MKIYFKQNDGTNPSSVFSSFGITDCYLKHLYIDSDANKVTRKAHHHNGFEIHIIEKGHQEYEVDGRIYSAKSGEFFFVPPYVRHKIVNSSTGTEKYSITFSSTALTYLDDCIIGSIPHRFFENVKFITNEYHNSKGISVQLIESSVFECAVMFLRLAGLREEACLKQSETDDLRLDSVKKYIADNIESWITVGDIAAYCYVSPKQVTRIFLKHEGMTPAQYVIKRRISYIQKLLESNRLSLKEISEKMNFQNEYYFNAFVKKHLGMPPGEYRKMVK
ncbi:MAG: AraC family transcriptional regulator [Oscillospiraceae bacterium]|nr:AraC family transcriptional regulator [Oscillospiraceae bacterium]MBQ6698523.1 AraC family transcriptional regulator [Oscillospiraceae bacterium]